MPNYHRVAIPYEANPYGISDVFPRARDTFASSTLRKTTAAQDRNRQDHFEAQLLRLSEYFGGMTLPVYLEWGGRRRMDKGCIGHSVARGFLQPVRDGSAGFVEQVTLSGR
jgi:hypothetical protein